MTNLDILQGYLDAYFGGDLDRAISFLADDFTITQCAAMPYAGQWIGHDGYRKLIDAFYSYWTDASVDLLHVIGDADAETFAVVVKMAGKSARGGRDFSTSICELYSVRNGKLAAVKPYYWDTKLLSELAQE